MEEDSKSGSDNCEQYKSKWYLYPRLQFLSNSRTMGSTVNSLTPIEHIIIEVSSLR